MLVGGCAAGQSLAIWGGSVFVMERIQRRSRPDWSVCMVGWHKIFFHVMASGRVEKQMVWLLVLAEWGASGVQLYVSPGTGLRCECGFMGSQGRA